MPAIVRKRGPHMVYPIGPFRWPGRIASLSSLSVARLLYNALCRAMASPAVMAITKSSIPELAEFVSLPHGAATFGTPRNNAMSGCSLDSKRSTNVDRRFCSSLPERCGMGGSHHRQGSAAGLQRTALNGLWRLVGARYAVAAAHHPATGLR